MDNPPPLGLLAIEQIWQFSLVCSCNLYPRRDGWCSIIDFVSSMNKWKADKTLSLPSSKPEFAELCFISEAELCGRLKARPETLLLCSVQPHLWLRLSPQVTHFDKKYDFMERYVKEILTFSLLVAKVNAFWSSNLAWFPACVWPVADIHLKCLSGYVLACWGGIDSSQILCCSSNSMGMHFKICYSNGRRK